MRVAALRELDHPPRALDVDRARSLQIKLKRHRRGAVHDLADLLGELAALAAEAETGTRYVAANRHHPLGIRVIGTEQGAQDALHASRRLAVIRPPHERIHAAAGVLQIAGQQLHADEPGGTCEQHPARLEIVDRLRGARRHAGNRAPVGRAGLLSCRYRRVSSSLHWNRSRAMSRSGVSPVASLTDLRFELRAAPTTICRSAVAAAAG